jgi:hypothetical protein
MGAGMGIGAGIGAGMGAVASRCDPVTFAACGAVVAAVKAGRTGAGRMAGR